VNSQLQVANGLADTRCGVVSPGIGLIQWFRFLSSGTFKFLSWKYSLRLAFISFSAVFNSLFSLLETAMFGSKIREQRIHPDIVFVLGHPRSGTTHLHYLLSKDPRFGFVDTLQAFYPNSFFVMRGWCSWLEWLMAKTMDFVPSSFDMPSEEEIAINVITGGMSPHGAFCVMPKYKDYLRYLDFEGCSQGELLRWQTSFVWFLKKFSYACGGKPLVVKSPSHTARLDVLRELFPRAKFVCIHRDPKQVVASFAHFIQEYYTYCFIAQTNDQQITDYMVEHYQRLYRSFNRAKERVPEGVMVEVSFDDLEKDPFGVLDKIYCNFGWIQEDQFRERVSEYLKSLGKYEKNRCKSVSPQLEETICQIASSS